MPNWYYEKSNLKKTPSYLTGLDFDTETRYRREGARFIQEVGKALGLRHDTMATAAVYFHRFYMEHSFQEFPRYVTATCVLFLAGKAEETPKKCKDLIRTVRTLTNDAQFSSFKQDPREEVMTLERVLLQTIKFDLQVDHPYSALLKYAKCLKGDKPKLQKMVQMSWTFVNDSLCTTLCLQWEPEVIAIALMYLAAKLSKFEVKDWKGKTDQHKHWWDLYVRDLETEVLEDICHQVLDLYSQPTTEARLAPPSPPPHIGHRPPSAPHTPTPPQGPPPSKPPAPKPAPPSATSQPAPPSGIPPVTAGSAAPHAPGSYPPAGYPAAAAGYPPGAGVYGYVVPANNGPPQQATYSQAVQGYGFPPGSTQGTTPATYGYPQAPSSGGPTPALAGAPRGGVAQLRSTDRGNSSRPSLPSQDYNRGPPVDQRPPGNDHRGPSDHRGPPIDHRGPAIDHRGPLGDHRGPPSGDHRVPPNEHGRGPPPPDFHRSTPPDGYRGSRERGGGHGPPRGTRGPQSGGGGPPPPRGSPYSRPPRSRGGGPGAASGNWSRY